MLRDHVIKRSGDLVGWGLSILSYHSTNFGGHKYWRGEDISSNINEGIRVVFFSRKDFTRTKKHKKHKKQASDFIQMFFMRIKV